MDISLRPLCLQISNTLLNVTKLISYSCQLIYLNTKSNAFYIKQLLREQKRKHFLLYFPSSIQALPVVHSM